MHAHSVCPFLLVFAAAIIVEATKKSNCLNYDIPLKMKKYYDILLTILVVVKIEPVIDCS